MKGNLTGNTPLSQGKSIQNFGVSDRFELKKNKTKLRGQAFQSTGWAADKENTKELSTQLVTREPGVKTVTAVASRNCVRAKKEAENSQVV